MPFLLSARDRAIPRKRSRAEGRFTRAGDAKSWPTAPDALHRYDLAHTLVSFGEREGDAWTIGDACEGTQIFGTTGSGKTSGSGRTLALAFLRAGFSGLVLCAKPDERELWGRYAAIAGREDDLSDLLARKPAPLQFPRV